MYRGLDLSIRPSEELFYGLNDPVHHADGKRILLVASIRSGYLQPSLAIDRDENDYPKSIIVQYLRRYFFVLYHRLILPHFELFVKDKILPRSSRNHLKRPRLAHSRNNHDCSRCRHTRLLALTDNDSIVILACFTPVKLAVFLYNTTQYLFCNQKSRPPRG